MTSSDHVTDHVTPHVDDSQSEPARRDQAQETTKVLDPSTRHSHVEAEGPRQNHVEPQQTNQDHMDPQCTSKNHTGPNGGHKSDKPTAQATVQLHRLNGEILVGPVFPTNSPFRKTAKKSRSKSRKLKNSGLLNNNVIYIEDITCSAEALPAEIGSQPMDVGMQPRNGSVKPRNNGTEPTNTGTLPKKNGTEPKSIGTVPRVGVGAKHVQNNARTQELGAKPARESIGTSRSGRPRKIPNKYLDWLQYSDCGIYVSYILYSSFCNWNMLLSIIKFIAWMCFIENVILIHIFSDIYCGIHSIYSWV